MSTKIESYDYHKAKFMIRRLDEEEPTPPKTLHYVLAAIQKSWTEGVTTKDLMQMFMDADEYVSHYSVDKDKNLKELGF